MGGQVDSPGGGGLLGLMGGVNSSAPRQGFELSFSMLEAQHPIADLSRKG